MGASHGVARLRPAARPPRRRRRVPAARARARPLPRAREPAATMTTPEAALGHRPKFDDVVTALAAAFEAEHAIDLRPDGLAADEIAVVERLVREKYATDVWLAGPA